MVDHSSMKVTRLKQANMLKCTCAIIMILGILVVMESVLEWVLHRTANTKYQAAVRQLAAKPPMGWNSWNKFACTRINADVVRQTAGLLVSTGLAKAGYIYVNIDDCWQLYRNETGYIQPDPKKFPGGYQGMKSLSDHIHGLGLKFGLYTDSGSLTCQKRPGSYLHEEKDAMSYVEMGVDYIKNDDCYVYPGTTPVENYASMYNALQNTNRPIVHSVKGSLDINEARKYSNVRRVDSDIYDEWEIMLFCVDSYLKDDLVSYSSPGFWNDLDMLEIGNGGMTISEYKTHFSLWAIMKSPLLLGHDLTKMPEDILKLLTNTEVIGINQDELGISAKLINNIQPEGAISWTRLTSTECHHAFSFQYKDMTKQIIVKDFQPQFDNKCIDIDSYKSLILKECDPDSSSQKWFIDRTVNKIMQHGNRSACITTSPYPNVSAKVRDCKEHRKQWKKNESWQPFNDVFNISGNVSSYFKIINTNYMCLALTSPPDINIYSGPLSNARTVVLVVNRDSVPRGFKLMFWELGLDSDVQYTVRDVWGKWDIRAYQFAYEANVDPHDCVLHILTSVHS